MIRENNNSMSRIVVTNVQVLTSGTKYDQDQSKKDGKPIKTTVVTLAVTPTDAERIALAATSGQLRSRCGILSMWLRRRRLESAWRS